MMPDISSDFSLQPVHTFGLLARAAQFIRVRTEDELRQTVAGLMQQNGGRNDGGNDVGRLPFVVLGEGSNTVFLGDVAVPVIRMALTGHEWLEPDADNWRLRVAAGENWHELVEWTLLQGRPGLENLALIPGSVGACPVQNIGAYGLEVMDRIESVRILDLATLQFRELSRADCRFAYRDSVFKGELAGKAIITAVTFRLPRQWQPLTAYADIARYLQQDARAPLTVTPQDVFKAVVAVRTAKLPDPRVQGNAGSFFKNPIVSAAEMSRIRSDWPTLVAYPQADGRHKLAAGWLIDQAGLKGFAIGGAAVSPKQALVLINLGGAKSDDLKRLIAHVQQTVRDRFGVELEPEPVMVV